MWDFSMLTHCVDCFQAAKFDNLSPPGVDALVVYHDTRIGDVRVFGSNRMKGVIATSLTGSADIDGLASAINERLRIASGA